MTAFTQQLDTVKLYRNIDSISLSSWHVKYVLLHSLTVKTALYIMAGVSTQMHISIVGFSESRAGNNRPNTL